jgi:photosystem II stability/assembly factor-like uncharacterized protein
MARQTRNAWVFAAALIGLSCSSAADSRVGERTEQVDDSLIPLAWVARGPAPILNGDTHTLPLSNQNPVTGAIGAVAAHPTNANILYAGTVNGGVWATNNALATNPTWTPLTDSLPSLSIGAISLDPANPQVIAAATGRWSSFGNDGGSQGQILVSKNAGQSWSVFTDPLFSGQKASSVAIRGNTILATFVDSAGLVRSTDGGAHWTQISAAAGSGLPFGSVDQLVPDPSSRSRFYLTMSQVGVFRSEDTGATWVNISQNDPGASGLNATVLGVNSGNSATKASICNDGRVYVGILDGSTGAAAFVGYSVDRGQTWVHMDVPQAFGDGIPFFHFAILGDPSNSSFVYISGPWQRGNAGIQPSGHFPSPQWSPMIGDGGTPNFTSPHVDPRNATTDANLDLIEVSDGGIFKLVRPRETTGDWFSLAGNLQTAEIHDIAYDSNANVLIAGTQDNGTPEQAAFGQLAWPDFSGNDGGDVAVDVLSNPGFSIRYSSINLLIEFTRATFNANNVLVSQSNPLVVNNGAGPQIQAAFDTPVVLNRVNPKRIVFGGVNSVYESFDQGDTVTFLGAAGNAHELAYGHPANADVIYAAAGQVFVRLTATGPLAPTAALFPNQDAAGIVLDPASFRTTYVVGRQHVFVTRDAGNSWTDITGNLASLNPGQLRSIEFVPGRSHNQIVVGANLGVFAASTSALGTWQQVGTNLPHAPVLELQFSAPKNLLVAGTLGRGAWSVTGLSN